MARTFQRRYKDSDGREQIAPRWSVEFTDGNGVARRLSAYKDKSASRALGRALERVVALKAVGEPLDVATSRTLDALPQRTRQLLATWGVIEGRELAKGKTVETLLEEFAESMRARGRTEHHVKQTVGRAGRLLSRAGVVFLSDLDALRVERALSAIVAESAGVPVKTEDKDKSDSEATEKEKATKKETVPLSPSTRNAILAAVRAFTRWACAHGLLSEEPLRVLTKAQTRGALRRQRRALSAKEQQALLKTTKGAATRFGVGGPERALLYWTALATGLRLGELRSLRASSLDLANPEHASLSVHASATKNRHAATLPIRPDLARALAEHVRGRLPAAPVFAIPSSWRAAEELACDLRAAKVAVIDEDGAVADFHALRHSFASGLSRRGVPVRVAMALMRHSDPKLTLATYSHLGADDEREALAALPDLGTSFASIASCAEQRATGTDPAPLKAASTVRPTVRNESSVGSTELPSDLLEMAAQVAGGSGGGIRTPDTRIMIPLL